MGIGENVGCNVGVRTGSTGGSRFLATPTNFSTSATTATTITVSWTEPALGAAIEYLVKDNGTGLTVATVATPSTGTTVTGLTPNTSYTFYVVTSDGTNESSPSNTDTALTDVLTGWVQHTTLESVAINTVSPTGLDAYQFSGANTKVVSVNDTALVPANIQSVVGSHICEHTQNSGAVTTGDLTVWQPAANCNIETIYEGDTVWFMQWWFVPVGYQWTSGVKGRRQRLDNSAGSSLGYFDVYIGGSAPMNFIVGVEPFQAADFNDSPTLLWNESTQAFELSPTGGRKFPLVKPKYGEWFCLETQITLGFPGVFRIWFTGTDAVTGNYLSNKLIMDNTSLKSIEPGSGQRILNYRNYGIWNSPGSPVTQQKYTGDCIITNDASSYTVDEYSNPIIGSGL